MRQLIFFIMILLTVSCNKDPKTVDMRQWQMTKVEGAITGAISQQIALTVSWPYSSGCDVLDKFEESRNGNIIIIKAYGHREEGICTMDAGIKTKIYNFVSTNTGTFELRFTNVDNSFISHTVTIN